MSVNYGNEELSKCSKCKSMMLLKYFSINKKGKLYKTCDNCRDKRKITIEKCQQVAEERGGKCLSTEYKTSKEKMLWKCSEGHQWDASYSSLMYDSSWCRKCYNIRQKTFVKSNILNIGECQQVSEERGGKCLSTEYKNSRTKMLWECSEGHQWYSIYDSVKKGHWCGKCQDKKNSVKRQLGLPLCHQVAESRGGKCLSKEYKNFKEKMLWECDKGHQWESCFKNIKNSNRWCPYCSGYRSEELARELMEELYGEKFKKVRPEWLEGLELDGYNEDLKIGFEYNGIQHYQYQPHFHRNGIEDLYKQQKNDHRKYEICKKRGIHLIVIPNEYSYQDEDEMRNFLEKNLK